MAKSPGAKMLLKTLADLKSDPKDPNSPFLFDSYTISILNLLPDEELATVVNKALDQVEAITAAKKEEKPLPN